jgi:hypothetical protein
MPRLRTLQTNLTSGELDPLLRGRSDVKHYFNGGEFLRNVLVVPQGGAIRRPGLRWVSELHKVISQFDLTDGAVTVTAPEGGTAGNAIDGDVSTEVLTTTNIGTVDPYVIIHVDLGAAQAIHFVDVEGLRVDPGTSSFSTDEVKWQHSPDDAVWTDLGDAFDSVDIQDRHKRRTGPQTKQYWRLVKIGGTTGGTDKFALDEIRFWTETATLSNARMMSFEFNITQRYLMVFTDRNMEVFRNGVKQVDVPSPYTSADLKTVDSVTSDITSINWTSNLDTLLIVHPSHQPRRFLRDGAHDEWNPSVFPINVFPSHPFEFVTDQTGTPAATTGTDINFTAGAAIFVAGDVGKFIRKGSDGYAEITGFTSSTVVVTTILTDFDSTDAIAAGEWTLEEATWSAARGWPVSTTFFQGRLWFAGSSSRPSSLWASKAGNFLNFSIGDASANDAIDVTADTSAGSVPEFINIHVGRHLQLFSTASEYYVPKSEDTGLTPTNFVLRETTDRGSKKGLRVQPVDGATQFIQRGGKALREFLFEGDVQFAYAANNISLLSSHLITEPLDIDIRRSTSTEEADYVLIVNNDGTLTAFCTLRDQNINAFTLVETVGDFLNVAVDRSEMYFCVKRTVNSTDRNYLEVFDDDLRVDAGIKATGVTVSSASGLDHLEGETVKVILDDSIQPDLVVSGGSVTFVRATTDKYQIGLKWPDVQEAEVVRLVAEGKTDRNARIIVYSDPDQVALNNEAWIKDMPVEGALPDGTQVGIKKRVPVATARVKDTTGLSINNNPIAFQAFGANLLDQAIPEFTGDKTEDGLLGWDDFGQVSITQNEPYKLKLLAIAKKVSV